MRIGRAFALFGAATVMICAESARADDRGLTLALRGGVGVPDVLHVFDRALTAAIGRRVEPEIAATAPLWAEAGYRLTRNLYAGAYFQYVPAIVNSGGSDGTSCASPGASCSARLFRLGAEAAFTFLPELPFAPWVGLGVGAYRIELSGRFTQRAPTDAFQADDFHSVDLRWNAIAQVGGAFRVGGSSSIGPYIAASVPALRQPLAEVGVRATLGW